jgi:predicted hotdog family 3-hydroxylacyl-ACP dehydratase
MTAAGAAGATFAPVASYLPHRPPMLLIDDIVDWSEERAVCRATIHPDCVFAIDGVVHPAAMIEFVAQACAIYVGVRSSRSGDPPQIGFIMACRDVQFEVDRFAVGDELTITATKVFGQKQLAAFTGTVARGGALCATVQLSVVDAALAASQHAGDDG